MSCFPLFESVNSHSFFYSGMPTLTGYGPRREVTGADSCSTKTKKNKKFLSMVPLPKDALLSMNLTGDEGDDERNKEGLCGICTVPR